MMRLVSGSNLEVPKNCEMGIKMGPAIGACARRPPAATGGVAPPGDPDSFGSEAVSRPTGMSPGVQMRFSYVQAINGPRAPDVTQYQSVLVMPHPDSAVSPHS